jgi:NADH:ubiquinone oxidoreductase subunit 5 (subunit L)/multisubunit Na+/H+ antiporter MnhA subunit
LTRALFKVLLFICAGGVIHSVGDSQDIRSIRVVPSCHLTFKRRNVICFI